MAPADAVRAARARKARARGLLPLAVTMALAFCAAAGCGRVGPPIPPSQSLLMPPSAPSLLGRDSALLLRWKPPNKTVAGMMAEGVQAYMIERMEFGPDKADCPGCPDEPTSAVYSEAPYYSDPGVTPGHRYKYRVRAIDQRGVRGMPSPYVNAVWVSPPPVPKIEVTPAHLSAKVTFTPPETDPSLTPVGLAVYGPDGTALTRFPSYLGEGIVSGLANDVPVSLTMRWEADTGQGWVIESDPVVIEVTPRDTVPPAPPTDLAAFRVPEGVNLYWLPVRGDPYDKLLVERSEDGERWTEVASLGGNRVSYLDRGVSSGVLYHYRVIPIDSAGNVGEPSATTSVRGGANAP